MSSPLLALNQNILAPEITQEAAKEALSLRKNISDLGFKAAMYEDSKAGVSPFMLIQLDRDSRDVFYSEAPATASLLEEMGSIPTSLDTIRVASGRKLFDVTINYCDVGTYVDPHQDTGNRYRDQVSRVATLCGNAIFNIGSPIDSEEIKSIEVGPGDMHEFLNPRIKLQRPLHWAVTIGTINRISVAYQEFVD